MTTIDTIYSQAAPKRRTQEWFALVLLPLGGFLFLVGWIAGVVLLWRSPAWTRREKVLATAVVPLGAALPVSFLHSVLYYSQFFGWIPAYIAIAVASIAALVAQAVVVTVLFRRGDARGR